MEKEFYSKVCVAESINFAIGKTDRKIIDLQVNDRFACSLATILARDKEMVAVRMKISPNNCIIYISKNNDWLEKDDEYIRKIVGYLKGISDDAPMTFNDAMEKDDTQKFFYDAMEYCSDKFCSRFVKLMEDIAANQHEQYVISFKSFFK